MTCFFITEIIMALSHLFQKLKISTSQYRWYHIGVIQMKLKRMRDFWIGSDANPKWTFESSIPCLLQKQNFENNQYEIVHRNLVEYHHLKLLKFCCWHMLTRNHDLIHRELGEYLLHVFIHLFDSFFAFHPWSKIVKNAAVIRAKPNLSLHCKLNLGGTAVDFSNSVFYSRFDRFPFFKIIYQIADIMGHIPDYGT